MLLKESKMRGTFYLLLASTCECMLSEPPFPYLPDEPRSFMSHELHKENRGPQNQELSL